jgi:hypothetical protein
LNSCVTFACLVLVAAAPGQYSREFQSSNLGTNAYGGSYGYDLDGDGAPNLWTRSSTGQIVVYSSSLTSWWTVNFPGYEYSYLATPRDVDGDGLVVPVNMDGDGAGEVVFSGAHYATDGYTGKIRVYDGSSRQLEWESSAIDGFTGYASVDDVDNDGKHEVIITRYDYTGGWGYVEVYGYVGAGIDGRPEYGLERSEVLAEPSVFESHTRVRFELAAATRARLVVLDRAGRRVRELLDARLPAGEYAVDWDGRDDSHVEAAAGVYLYRLELDGTGQTGRLVLAR